MKRNLIRRRVKELFRTAGPKQGYNVTVIARKPFDASLRKPYIDEARRLIALLS